MLVLAAGWPDMTGLRVLHGVSQPLQKKTPGRSYSLLRLRHGHDKDLVKRAPAGTHASDVCDGFAVRREDAGFRARRGVIEGTHNGNFMGIPPTNKKIYWTGTRVFKAKNGKVTEGWINFDMMGLMQQMGIGG